MKTEAPRGTHDILPSEQPIWRKVTGEMERVCALYGYRPIETPAFEDTELFERTSGAGSDIVQKEMYTFEDRSHRSLTLRPEGTAPVCRAYVQHGMQREPQPVKLYTVGPMWRYGRPGRGRYREFWQLSLEAIGSDDAAVDAEVVQVYAELLRRLGVTEYELQLNSIGDRNCRPAYVETLRAWLDEHDAELDDEAREKRVTSPLRVFDIKSEKVRTALAAAPKIGESLCDACREHFDSVRAYLDAYGVSYTLEPTLVRGLDYYTRTAFEFIGPEENVNSTICGGGRYDYLIEEIGGPPTPAVGFATGIERLILALEREGVTAEPEHVNVFFAVDGDADRAQVLRVIAELRRAGRSCDTDYAQRSLNGQIKLANRLESRWIVIVKDGEAIVRERGERDVVVTLAELPARLAP